MYSADQIKKAVLKKGYVWFEDHANKNFDVNIVGVRNLNVGQVVTNKFDDILTITYKENGVLVYKEWPITTDAGTKGVKQFHNPKGVARLIPDQYRGSHAIRLHQGKYEALGQQKPVKVWRDVNKDMTFDEVLVDQGLFGINIHRSNPKTQSEYVENWSEGCQVFKRLKDFEEFMEICRKARDIHGNSFTYTLITTKDLD
jgi:hypothetical protein